MSDWLGALIGAAERTIRTLATHKRPKRNPIQQIVLQAKQAGIHPLVALQGGFSGQPLYGSQVDWSTDSGFGDAIGGFQNYLEEQQATARSESNYDRRRAEDRMFERELRVDPMKRKFDEAQLKLIEAQTQSVLSDIAAKQRMGASRTTSDGVLNMENWPPAQEVQNVYDDWVSGPYGVAKYVNEQWLGGDPKRQRAIIPKSGPSEEDYVKKWQKGYRPDWWPF